MIRPSTDLTVYLCREPVDMRKQFDGLALLVQEAMELNPFDKALFVFGDCQQDKIKLLFWAGKMHERTRYYTLLSGLPAVSNMVI